MHLSILKINSPEMQILLESHVNTFNISDLSSTRPTQATRRICALALTRDLLIKNDLLSMHDAKLTTIQHLESGEPYILPPRQQKIPLQITLSHSGLWIAVLISPDTNPAGIDLEDLSIKRNFLKLANHYYSSDEIAYVEQNGSEAFYKLWTIKESIAKLQGKGLAEVLKIHIDPSSLDTHTVNHQGCSYFLTQHISKDYIYTIAQFTVPTVSNNKIFIEST